MLPIESDLYISCHKLTVLMNQIESWQNWKLPIWKVAKVESEFSISCQISKLPSCQVANCQIAKLPSCQIASCKLLNCELAIMEQNPFRSCWC